jgi:hypothetical protein
MTRCGERVSSLAKRHNAMDFFQPHATRIREADRAHHFRAVTDYCNSALAVEMIPQFQIGQTVRLARGLPNRADENPAGAGPRSVSSLPGRTPPPPSCARRRLGRVRRWRTACAACPRISEVSDPPPCTHRYTANPSRNRNRCPPVRDRGRAPDHGQWNYTISPKVLALE